MAFVRISNLENEYLAKSALEKWRYVRGFHVFLARNICVGMVENYKVTWKTLFPTLAVADYV